MQSSNSSIKIASIRTPCHHYVAEQEVRRGKEIPYTVPLLCNWTPQHAHSAVNASQIADCGLSDFYPPLSTWVVARITYLVYLALLFALAQTYIPLFDACTSFPLQVDTVTSPEIGLELADLLFPSERSKKEKT